MNLFIKINLDNDAFQDGNEEHEIARILRKIATRKENLEPVGGERDINGNTVCSVWKQPGRLK